MARHGRSFPARGGVTRWRQSVATAGTASIALGDVTLASTGTLAIAGTGSPTLGNVTLSSTGTVALAGTASITLGDVTLAATGSGAVNGTAAITLGNVTLASTGTVALAGTASITLGNVTSAGTGAVAIAGAGTPTLGNVTLSATGALAIAATASITLGDVTLAATGTGANTGVAAITLGDVTLAATGTVTGTGTEQHFQGAGSVNRSDIKRLKKARRKMAEALERQLRALTGDAEEEAEEATIAGVPSPEAPPLIAEAKAAAVTLADLIKAPASAAPPISLEYVQDLLTRLEDFIERQDEDELMLLAA